MDITQLLAFGVEQGASDCHLSAGEPPMVRIHGDLKKLDHAPLTKEEAHALVYDIMNDAQRKAFEETHECDFSFEMGTVARFRVNVFMQRKGEGDIKATLRKGKRADSRYRSYGFRQVDHLSWHGGLSKRDLRRTYLDRRRSHRVCSSVQEVSR